MNLSLSDTRSCTLGQIINCVRVKLFTSKFSPHLSDVTEHKSPNWNAVTGLVSELKRCDEYGITGASIAMAFVCIDTLAGLARPEGKVQVTRSDFISWVDTYLEADDEQPYQYRGKDVYAARCALLHTYGVESAGHSADPDTKKFGYNDGGKHYYNSEVDSSLVIIGTKSFINDVILGVESFTQVCVQDLELRSRVEPRLDHVLDMAPFPNNGPC